MGKTMLRHGIRHRRGQREFKPLPTAEVAIPKYPGEPTEPTKTSGLLLVAPVAGVMLMSVGFGIIYQNYLYPLVIVPVSLVYPLVMRMRQRDAEKKWAVERDRVQDAYRKRVGEVQDLLGHQRQQQAESLEWTYPTPAELVLWAAQGSERLWERRPDDSDFMQLRVGTGSVPTSFPIKMPKVEIPELAPELLLDAVESAADYAVLESAPLAFDFPQGGSLGLSGPRQLREAATRAILTSAAALHAPDDLDIYAILPSRGIADWEWMKWLPHTRAIENPAAIGRLSYERDRSAQLLAGLLDELESRGLRGQSIRDEPFILLIVADYAAVAGEAAVERIISDGPALGAGMLFLAPSPRDLPHGCRGRLELRDGQQAVYFATEHSTPVELRPELVGLAEALRLARGLTPIRLVDSQTAGELPNQIRLLELLNSPDLERVDFQARWLRALRESPTLRVPIGMRHGDRPLEIDLQQSGHGPHGLIAGTTGSGKSELLLTLLTSLALANHPHQVNWVLVDYKGGTAMSVLNDLPHTVGVVTDLDGKQTRRALVALRSELTRREELLARYEVADIDKYHQLGYREPFPYLFIVIDEFAELRERFQDDLGQVLNEFVSIAQKGRALGVHLILAMQRPEGVVNDRIRANMRYRICLRVERSQDSRSVLGRPDAYLLPSQPPGRAYFQVGNDEQFDLFQVARVAGLHRPDGRGAAQPEVVVREVAPDGRRIDLYQIKARPDGADQPDHSDERRTEAQLLVEKARSAAETLGIQRLDPPWPPALPSLLPLDHLLELSGVSAWDGENWPERDAGRPQMPAVPIGLVDDPSNQRQGPHLFNMEDSGNLLILGSPGTGRTTSLLTLVTSLARTFRPDELHVHLIDFAGHQLRAGLGEFPHVAGAYGTQDRDRIRRLLRDLSKELERRQGLFERAGAVSLSGYWRSEQVSEPLPAVLTVINNFTGFREAFIDEIGPWLRLLREGGAYGMHFAISSDRFPPGPVADLLRSRIALRIADRMMYTLILGARPDLKAYEGVPGRGFINSDPVLQIQMALPSSGDTEAQISRLQELGLAMGRSWTGPRPKRVEVLGDQVALAAMLKRTQLPEGGQATGAVVPVGLDGARLEPAMLDLVRAGSYLLICGPPQGGKTTALATISLELAARYGPEEIQLGLVTPNRSERFRLDELAKLQHVIGQAKTEKTLSGLLDRLEAEAERRSTAEDEAPAARSRLMLLLDDYHLLLGRVGAELVRRIDSLARKGPDIGMTTVLTVPTTVLATLSDPLLRQAQAWRNGIWLQSTDSLEGNRVGVKIPNELRGRELPPGRGFLYDPGGQQIVQVASPELADQADPAAPATLADWVAHLRG